MKKHVLLTLLILSLFYPRTANADSWDEFSNVDRMWDGQKSITNQDFEKVVETLEEKKNQNEEKVKKKKRKKLFGSGTTLHEELNPDNNNIKELESLKSVEDLVINVPVKLKVNNKILEKGFYKVLSKIDEKSKKKYIELYQSHSLIAEIEVIETKDDFEEKELNFAKLIPYNDSFVKIIFGCLDFNGYAFIPYIE